MEQAVAAHQAGDLQQACRYYRQVLKTMPDNTDIMHTIGGLYYQMGNLESAGQYLEMAHKNAPENLDYLNDLGAFLLTTGNYTSAVDYLRLVTEKMPQQPQGYYNLGLALHGAAKLAEAIPVLENAVRLQPDYAAAIYTLAVIYFELGQYLQAESMCRKTLQLAPSLPQAHHLLGKILSRQQRHDVAVAAYQKACEMDSGNMDYLVSYARALHEARKTEEGIQLLQEQLEKYPDEASLLSLLGELLHVTGRIDESEKLYQQALSKHKDMASVLFNYAYIRNFSLEDEEIIRRIEHIIADRNLPERSRIALGFALGKIYDDCHDYDRAFENYRMANSLKHKRVTYDRDTYEKKIDAIISVFNRNFFDQCAFHGEQNPQPMPVFIVGMPRSGTTLTEQILSSHPGITGADELSYFQSLTAQLAGLLQSDKPWPECCRSLDQSVADQITGYYLELLRRYSSTAKFVTDKMPQNYHYLGLIRCLFPSAPVIHCRRDPMDVCLSIYFQNFSKSHSYAFDLTDIGHMYLQYERLMHHWQQVLPGPLLQLDYEELINDQERTSQTLVAFCGLEWDQRCLEFFEHQRDVRTASNWQVRQPVYSGSVGRWKNYENYLAPLMKLFTDSKAKI